MAAPALQLPTATPILNLPNELLFQIAEDFGPKDLNSFLRVNHYMARLLTRNLHHHAIQDRGGLPALCWAAKRGHISLVHLLLEKKFDVNTKDKWNEETVLHYAAGYGHHSIVKLLLENGANINAIEAKGRTPLSRAIESVHLVYGRVFKQKISTAQGYENSTLERLRGAMIYQVEATFKLLLQNGVNLNMRDKKGWTVLHTAANCSKEWKVWEVILTLLLDSGADIEAEDTLRNWTPLHLAAESGSELAVRLLLERGANVNAVSTWPWGETPLHMVTKNNEEYIMELLKEIPNILTPGWSSYFRNQLHLRKWSEPRAIVLLLLERGADINAADIFGQTVLDIAVGWQVAEVELRGVIDCLDNQIRHQSTDFVNLLLANGAVFGRDLNKYLIEPQLTASSFQVKRGVGV